MICLENFYRIIPLITRLQNDRTMIPRLTYLFPSQVLNYTAIPKKNEDIHVFVPSTVDVSGSIAQFVEMFNLRDKRPLRRDKEAWAIDLSFFAPLEINKLETNKFSILKNINLFLDDDLFIYTSNNEGILLNTSHTANV